jgi:hypothetical protein
VQPDQHYSSMTVQGAAVPPETTSEYQNRSRHNFRSMPMTQFVLVVSSISHKDYSGQVQSGYQQTLPGGNIILDKSWGKFLCARSTSCTSKTEQVRQEVIHTGTHHYHVKCFSLCNLKDSSLRRPYYHLRRGIISRFILQRKTKLFTHHWYSWSLIQVRWT